MVDLSRERKGTMFCFPSRKRQMGQKGKRERSSRVCIYSRRFIPGFFDLDVGLLTDLSRLHRGPACSVRRAQTESQLIGLSGSRLPSRSAQASNNIQWLPSPAKPKSRPLRC